jgi:hypothetical protein
MTRTYYAGQELEAPCGRCGGATLHQVLSITDGVPDRLICGACRSTHRFRAPKPERAPRPTRVAAAARVGGPRLGGLAGQFQDALSREQGETKARPYALTEVWSEGAWMRHPTYGLGRVQRRVAGKIQVLFHNGMKTLVSA